ncbi:MAG: carbon monoxide dehydrogenase subunit G [Alphaproteobacteria bacterium]|nr:carbon monoxide dehydrogenase subunit G [Alphaproteobacteria bacterium]
MDMTGEQRIPAPKQVVWDALNDVEALKASIPGCKEVEKKSDTEFSALVQIAVGPVKATFKGEVTLSNIDAPNGYTLAGQGTGGAAGFGKGSAEVTLREENGETIVSYNAHASVGGKLAQIGQRLIDSTAKKLTKQFFENFAAYITAQQGPAEDLKEEAAPAAAAATQGGGQFVFWGIIGAALVILWIINHLQ